MIPSKKTIFYFYICGLGCLEDCLKYVLLLNFEEEPRYDYLIDELKRAYIEILNERGDKVPNNAFKQPVFDWNVSLATRFQKSQTYLDDSWMDGEGDIYQSS
jgi:hypothetical protein